MTGIICAMAIELDGIKELMTKKEEVKKAHLCFYKGELFGKEIVAVQCGIGKVNAAMCTQLMIDLFSPDAVINSGIAGALTYKTRIGDIVIADDIVQHDMNTTALGDKRGTLFFPDETCISIGTSRPVTDHLFAVCEKAFDCKVIKGRIASGDLFVSDRKKRTKIRTDFNAVACEMEGAAVGHVCYRNDVPFAILRCISDDMDENRSMDYEKFKCLAAEKSIEAIKGFIKG